MQQNKSVRASHDDRDPYGLLGSPHYRASAVDYFHKGPDEPTEVNLGLPRVSLAVYALIFFLTIVTILLLFKPHTREFQASIQHTTLTYPFGSAPLNKKATALITTTIGNGRELFEGEELALSYRGNTIISHVHPSFGNQQSSGKQISMWIIEPAPVLDSPQPVPVTAYVKTSLFELMVH